MAVNAVYKKHFTGIFFPMAFIFLLFEGEIARLCGAKSDDLISTWAVLLCALLMTAGFAIIGPHKKKQAYKHNEEYNMGQFTRYIDCTDFTYHSVENNLGKCDIFFVNTENYTSGGTVSIYNNLGSTVIHVPSDWRPIVDIDNSLGSVSVPTQQEGICKILNIVGENNLGSINIKTV